MNTRLAPNRCLVLGAGKTGRSVATFLAARGTRVRLAERTASAFDVSFVTRGIEARVGDEGADLLDGVDLVVPSPGVPSIHPTLRRAAARGVPVMSEIELAAHFLACPILAVTGTNGKSTTTTLLGAMVCAAGRRAFVGGNLGTPLIDACAAEAAWDVVVVEVSSFQLEWVNRFRPAVSVLLNLTPDHLDRYETMAAYGAAKARLLAAQRAGDVAVLNRDDKWVWDQRRRTRAAVVSFGREPVEFGSFANPDALTFWGPTPAAHQFSLERVQLAGAHNRENMMAAVTAAAIWGVPPDAIQHALDTTRGLPHRLEFVREVDGVRFYDDSKGTNVGAMEKSLASFEHGVVLLAGGHDKGGEFRGLGRLLAGRVKHVVLFGAAGPTIDAQLPAGVARSLTPTLAAAVEVAASVATAGDTVLLSPGCASFDEFTDYTARGRRFRALVEAL